MGRVTDREAGRAAQTEMGEGGGQRLSKPDPATLPGTQRTSAHTGGGSEPASCAGARPRRPGHVRQRTQAQAPAAAPPTWSPRLLDTPPGHTRCAQTESSLHSHRPLPSLPRPLCNQIPKFRSNPGPSQGSPPPPAACGGPARVLWSIEDPTRASWSWELLGSCRAKSATTPPSCGAVGPHGATLGPPSPQPRCPPHLKPELQGLFPPLKSRIGHQAPGWGGLDKGGE